MVTKVNGKVGAGEFLGRDLDYYTLTMDFSVMANTTVVAAAMEKIVETISQNGQPILLGAIPTAVSNAATLKFAIEHKASWQDGETLLSADKAGTTLDTALETLIGHIDGSNTTTGKVTVTKTQTLS